MLELLIGYLAFAVTTGMTACLLLFNPVMSSMSDTVYSENKIVSYLVFFVLSTLFAPIAFICVIIPKKEQ